MLAPMNEAGWVAVAVDPLVPPARLGALLGARRREQGIDIVEMAQRSGGMFTPTYLENVERGVTSLDDRIVDHLVGLYEIDAGPVVPQRSELILDVERQKLGVGDRTVSFDSLHADDVLDRYLSLIYLLRGIEPGADLTLRDGDLEILGETLGFSQTDVRRELRTRIAAPESVHRAKSVRTRTMVMAAGVLVGITAVGALVLVGAGRNNEPTEVLGTTQTFATSGYAVQLGSAAEALVDYDFRGALPGWEIGFSEDHPDFLGVTLSANKSITVHVEPGSSPETVAAVLMHEVGHAIDLERLDDDQRSQWIEMRSMPSVWWPGDGLSDFAVGAGDFAEAVAALTTNSPSSSVYGDFTQEQLDFVAEVIGNG